MKPDRSHGYQRLDFLRTKGCRARRLSGQKALVGRRIGSAAWLYTFWYQIKPFSTSGNADALVWGLMAMLTLGFVFLPFIPVLRSLPRHLGVHRLIWRAADSGTGWSR